MKLIWLEDAAASLDRDHDSLAARSPRAAHVIFTRIVATALRHREFLNSGRPGRVEGTRELVVPGTPYVIVYRVLADTVEILRVFHTSRDWPELML